MTEFNVRADYAADPKALPLDDALDALQDLHVVITEEADGSRSYTLTVDARSAWDATETALARLADVGAERERLVALETLTTAAFDAREEVV